MSFGRSGYTPKMAAGMWGTSNPLMSGASTSQAQAGPDLDEVQTEGLGFLALAGDTKVRILPTPWPSNAPPKPTSSLFSIASRAGLFAAASPNALILGKTDDIRAAFTKEGPSENNVKPYEPTLSLPVPRVSQVVFSSDDKYLIACAEEGGGLQVYETESLLKGNTQHAFQIGTESIAVRSLAPNPVEGHVFALVLADGKLMLANMQTRGFVNTSSGSPLLRAGGVSCVSWSARGKQLVAGLDDGTLVQLAPDGTVKAEIPKPPQLSASAHVSSMIWLDNNSFLTVYNPNDFDPSTAPDSGYFLVTRQDQQIGAQKFSVEPCPPFGMNRSPPHQFLGRLRNWEPNLKDTLVVSSTCSGDIGLIANSATPLSADAPTGLNVYSVLQLDDTRRAQMPLGSMEDMAGDTSPIGMAIDLSSNEPVKRPIPKEEEFEASRTPLPAVMILNNEGILSAWWYIYNESILQSKPYHGLITASNYAPAPEPTPAKPVTSQPAFGSAGLGGFNASKTAAAGSSVASPSPWGSNSSAANPSPAGGAKFGQASFGQASTPAFGKPAFGAPSGLGGSNTKQFGGALGSTASSWSQVSASSDASKPVAFSSFASAGAQAASPFSSMNNKSDTPAFGAAKTDSASAAPASSPFGSLGDNKTETSLFGTTKQEGNTDKPPTAAFGLGAGAQTGWGFGGVGNKSNDTPTNNAQPSFGSTMTLGSTAPSLGQAPSSLGSGKSLFGTPSLSNNTSDGVRQTTEKAPTATNDKATTQPDSVFGQGMGGLSLGSSTPKQPEPETTPPKIKEESSPEPPPLPVDPPARDVGQSPKSKTVEPDDIPLPPDPNAAKPTSESNVQPEEPPLPPSPKSAPTTDLASKDTPLDTPLQPLKSQDHGDASELPRSPSSKSRSLTPVRSRTPPVDLRTSPSHDQQQEDQSPAGSEPVDLGDTGHTPPSPTKSLLPEEDNTEPGMRNATWPRSVASVGMPEFNLNKSTAQRPISPGREPATPSVYSPDNTRTIQKPSYPSYDSPLQTQPPVVFQPPAGAQSPRSPSPVRGQQYASNRPRPASRRSGQSPLRSQGLSPDRNRGIPSNAFTVPSQSGTSQDLAASTGQPLRESIRNRSSIRNPNEELVDEESEDEAAATQAALDAPLESSRDLGNFLAHQDYVGRISSQGLASQIERVYRDIDSMVDTLGFNARTLGSFIKGHTESDVNERTREDLYPHYWDRWILEELPDLAALLRDLTTRLASGRPRDVRATIEECRVILQKSHKARLIQADLTQHIGALHPDNDEDNDDSQSDPDDSFNPAQLPKLRQNGSSSIQIQARNRLSHSQSQALTSLRSAYTRTQQQIAKAEDAVSLLQSRLSATAGPAASNIPTVEATTSTIAKMTRMAEQKRTNLDMLESQLDVLLKQKKIKQAGANEAFGLGSLKLGSASPRNSPLASRSARNAANVKKSKAVQGRRDKESSPGTFSVPEESSDESGANDEENDSAYESAASTHTPQNRMRRQYDTGDDADEAELNALRNALRSKLKQARTSIPSMKNLNRKDQMEWATRERRTVMLLEGLKDAVKEVAAGDDAGTAGEDQGGNDGVVVKIEDD